MPVFRERLHPSVWLHLVALLAIPASMLVLAPVSVLAGAVTGIAFSGGLIIVLWALSPVIEIADGALRAGRARIPLDLLSDVVVARGTEARHARGPGLDARAWLLLRGDIDAVVRVDVSDADDPAPYWLLSTRRPDELAGAIDAVRG
jgi:hypothetical protein